MTSLNQHPSLRKPEIHPERVGTYHANNGQQQLAARLQRHPPFLRPHDDRLHGYPPRLLLAVPYGYGQRNAGASNVAGPRQHPRTAETTRPSGTGHHEFRPQRRPGQPRGLSRAGFTQQASKTRDGASRPVAHAAGFSPSRSWDHRIHLTDLLLTPVAAVLVGTHPVPVPCNRHRFPCVAVRAVRRPTVALRITQRPACRIRTAST